MSDAALLIDMIKALEEAGVSVEKAEEGFYRFTSADYTQVKRLPHATVSRGVLAELNRRFGVPISKFYPLTRIH